MTSARLKRRSIGQTGALAMLVTGLAATPALAKPATQAVDTSACVTPQLSQPFLAANDTNLYTLAPGETADNFTAAGWTLAGGARIITTRLADGHTGQVLDLPAGSRAVSPSICVSSDYPTARTMVQNANGAQVVYSVAYAGTKAWDKQPKPLGPITAPGAAWSLSDPFQVNPGTMPGWQLVRFTFQSGKHANGDAQMYNFYIDPRMKR